MESARVGAADADGADPAGPEGAILGPADLAGPDPARLPDFARVWVCVAVPVWLVVFAGILRRGPGHLRDER